MALIPQNDKIKFTLNKKETVDDLRPYLGFSMIGENCHRYLQHYHYWTFHAIVSSRLRRLFDFGHLMEPQMIESLAGVGIHVKGEQKSMTGTGGHWKGHCDGVAIEESTPEQEFLAEFKTHNDRNFKSLKKLGVEKGFPKHKHQMNSYMGYLKLPFAFYLGYNKNDSEYHYETIQFDIELFNEDRRKEAEVIMSDVLLPRVGNDSATWHECKLCSAKHVCFGKTPIVKTCRSCQHVDTLEDGVWFCSHHDRALTVEDQREACDTYKLDVMFHDNT